MAPAADTSDAFGTSATTTCPGRDGVPSVRSSDDIASRCFVATLLQAHTTLRLNQRPWTCNTRLP